jgi:hypothetical protein
MIREFPNGFWVTPTFKGWVLGLVKKQCRMPTEIGREVKKSGDSVR